eukprot:CAMPEP_0172439390 /NCGR_PEP_ID=MMETSP1065-20121228/394_1 /TAXON_ID=265537 /ORGANISM="Amphiprora paludosa, Strain CCMP125" /LENGTH=169 /DNA_ID=CAMNT_0013188069 /DNA_START=57 /DNA_END=566 /DNA_ORIENTATION=-
MKISCLALLSLASSFSMLVESFSTHPSVSTSYIVTSTGLFMSSPLYEERTRKVADAAGAGKSRWGTAENQRAAQHQQPGGMITMAESAKIVKKAESSRSLPSTFAHVYPANWEMMPVPLSQQWDKQSDENDMGVSPSDYLKSPPVLVTLLNPTWKKPLSVEWNKGLIAA